jgi:hypothetical protein
MRKDGKRPDRQEVLQHELQKQIPQCKQKMSICFHIKRAYGSKIWSNPTKGQKNEMTHYSVNFTG